jgi:hypothetical protein
MATLAAITRAPTTIRIMAGEAKIPFGSCESDMSVPSHYLIVFDAFTRLQAFALREAIESMGRLVQFLLRTE